MALQQPGFDLSPQASSTPLGVEDVDWLVENGKPIFKDSRKRALLLQRIRNTLQMYRSAMNDLHREINRLQAELSAPGMSSGALDPLSAARYLSDEQKEQLFTGSMKQAWTALLRLRADATKLRAQANSDLGAARFALARVLEDTTISETVRQQASRRLAELPPAVAVELAPLDSPLPDLPAAPGWQVAGAAVQQAAPGQDAGDNGVATAPHGAGPVSPKEATPDAAGTADASSELADDSGQRNEDTSDLDRLFG